MLQRFSAAIGATALGLVILGFVIYLWLDSKPADHFESQLHFFCRRKLICVPIKEVGLSQTVIRLAMVFLWLTMKTHLVIRDGCKVESHCSLVDVLWFSVILHWTKWAVCLAKRLVLELVGLWYSAWYRYHSTEICSFINSNSNEFAF